MPSMPSSPTMPPHKVLSASSTSTLALGVVSNSPTTATRRANSIAATGVNGNLAENQ